MRNRKAAYVLTSDELARYERVSEDADATNYTSETMFIHQAGKDDVRTTVWRDHKERVTITEQTTWSKHYRG
jgi:hypothetical protein